jgi:hypothetical protein
MKMVNRLVHKYFSHYKSLCYNKHQFLNSF